MFNYVTITGSFFTPKFCTVTKLITVCDWVMLDTIMKVLMIPISLLYVKIESTLSLRSFI